jgi:hypothetical protein
VRSIRPVPRRCAERSGSRVESGESGCRKNWARCAHNTPPLRSGAPPVCLHRTFGSEAQAECPPECSVGGFESCPRYEPKSCKNRHRSPIMSRAFFIGEGADEDKF